MDTSVGVFRHRIPEVYYLRKRLSRKPQTTTAPGSLPDEVTVKVLLDDGVNYIIQITNVCGGDGELNVIKINVSEIVSKHGYIVDGVNIDRIKGNVGGFTNVQLEWDATTDSTIPPLGEGKHDHHFLRDAGPLIDPQEAGYTGDVLLTTTGNQSGDSYTLTIFTTVRYE